MFVVIEKKERARGRILSCRRSKGCRCEPRCNNRPTGYEDEMVPYYKVVTIRPDHIEVDNRSRWQSPVLSGAIEQPI